MRWTIFSDIIMYSNMLKRILHSRARNITFGALILVFSAGVSRVFGLVRTGLVAGYFGRGEEADIYFAAFRIPDLIYNLLIVGGILIAFLPLFSEYFAKDEQKAWAATNHILNVFLVLLLAFSALLFIFTPQLINLITPGFSETAKATTVKLTRLMFLSPLLLGLASIFSGILQYFHRFFAYSLAPILYNVGIIAGIVFLYPKYGVYGAAIGVVAGALLHLVIQIPTAIHCGYRYRFSLNFKAPAVKKIFRLMIPRFFAISSQQLNLLSATAIASTIHTGALSIFTYANDLQYFPIGIVAIPFAMASFPALSRAWADGRKAEFLRDFSLVFRQIVFLVAPLGFLIFILRAQIVRLILGSLGPSHFDWVATRLTAASLGIFALGIMASALIPLLSRAFFSFQDTKTPTIIAVVSFVLNIALNIWFTRLLADSAAVAAFVSNIMKLSGISNIAVLGLPLAFSCAALFQFALLAIFLRKKAGDFGLKEIWQSFKNIALVSAIMTLAVYFLLYLLNNFVETQTVFGLLLQTIGAGMAGVAVYLLLSWQLKMTELKALFGGLRHQFAKQ